jgi:hypothetical protein
MDASPQNPIANQIAHGVTEQQITTAVERSGYPLQIIVAEILRPHFEYIQQEWPYVDRDQKELRSIDVYAQQHLHEWDPQPRVRPTLSVLIECKQSQLPYIFFPSTSGRFGAGVFPRIVGLRKKLIQLTTDDDLSTYSLPVPMVLNLARDPFCSAPSYCNTLSKCVRKGAEIELSGTDAYFHLILPLIKAAQHFEVAEHPVDTAWYFDARMVLAVGVLDAPMITATTTNNTTSLTLLPWVRVQRHEYSEEAETRNKNQVWTVDIVHKEFLKSFVTDHLLPFARGFAESTLRHQTELATGNGFASGMGANSWGNLEARLEPRPRLSRFSRTLEMGKQIFRLMSGRRKES